MKNTTSTIKKGAQKRFRAGTGVQRLHDELIDLAYASHPDAQLPSYQELCDSFGTSPSSLRQALDELERRDIIYRKRGHGIYVSPKLHQKSVRIFFNSTLISRSGLSPFWGILSGLILTEAQKRGVKNQVKYSFELVTASHFHDAAVTGELIELYQEGQIHGVLAIGMGEQPTLRAVDPSVPIVTYADYGHWQVRSNVAEAMRMGISALARKGCERIAMWNHGEEPGDLDGEPLMPQLETIFRENGVPFNPELVYQPYTFLTGGSYISDLTYQEQGYLTALRVFKQPGPRPDGLLLADDMLANGALTAFAELGVKPGADVQVVSICNAGTPILFGHDEAITLVEYDSEELVRALFDVLEVLMAQEQPDRGMMMLKPKLINPGDRMRLDEIKARFGV